MSGEVFLKLSEVCDLLHVDIATGHNWVKLGKLVPSGEDLRGRPLFSQSSVQKQLQDVRKLCDPRLKSRRNKSALRGRGLYGNYAGRNSGNVGAVNELILRLKGGKGMMCACLLEAAIRLLHAAGRIPTPSCLPHGSYFLAWRSGFIDPFPYDFLLEPLMEHHSAESLCSYTEKLPEFTLEYIPYEDTLGLLYLSLCDISSRLEGGRYYTPQDLTDEVVADLGDEHDRFLDPCCGSGNFLLRLLKRGVTPENLYGADIDAISLALCRINFAVNTAVSEKEFYKRHFILGNTLRIPDLPECNVILGNPPWGSCTDRELTQEYAKSFVSAGRNRPCMADLFVERMLMQLPLGGILRFLLPESLLNVAVHQKLRSLISQTAKVRQVRYLGEVFHAVQCPSVVLTLKKGEGAGEEHSGIEVTLPERSFTVQRKSCGIV